MSQNDYLVAKAVPKLQAVSTDREVSNAISRVDHRARELSSLIEALAGRLAPVLKPQAPQAANGPKDTPYASCDFETRMNETGATLAQSAESIESLLERLAI